MVAFTAAVLMLAAYRFAAEVGALSYFSKIRQFLIATVLVNLPFVAGPEVLALFFFFFFTMYFSELHFFFIYSLGLSSDSLVYQFNFLLSGFSFIFFFKFYRNLNTSGIFFSFVTLLQSNLNFAGARVTSASGRLSGGPVSGGPAAFIRASASVFVLSYYIFFFLTTFIVWALRYVIQFVRLLVLYMIHTVFEFAIISNDTYSTAVNSIGFFFFKSFFLFFFFFWGFMYLLVYLNLMFTLQAFIFFFFSEVFQSNFLFDLSAVVSGSLKLVPARTTQ